MSKKKKTNAQTLYKILIAVIAVSMIISLIAMAISY